MTVTTNEFGQSNVWAKEPQMKIQEVTVTHNEKAEKLNGRLAMLGVIAALGAYAVTGQIIPGIWWLIKHKYFNKTNHCRQMPAILKGWQTSLLRQTKCIYQENNWKNWLK